MRAADPMEKVKLGRTNLFASRICFGTTSLADMPDTYGYGVGPERAKETLRAIFDGPANFSTPPAYTDFFAAKNESAMQSETAAVFQSTS